MNKKTWIKMEKCHFCRRKAIPNKTNGIRVACKRHLNRPIVVDAKLVVLPFVVLEVDNGKL